MGRSKFPGKPSKHVNRQRVNVLACPQNRETKVVIAENIFIGLNTSNLDSKTEQETETKSEQDERQTKKFKKAQIQRKRRLVTKKIEPIRRTQIRHRTRSELLARRSRSADSINLGGKFILPQRSAHSSRVIKPNKRFVDSENEPEPVNKVKTSSDSLIQSETETEIRTCDGVESPRDCSPVNSDYSTTNPQSNNNPRLILRKAKLQLNSNHNSPTHRLNDGGQGPFSMSASSVDTASVSPGTVTCGVCGAVRFYRFVKQARKFSIYSCESCRKFISKMIKRQACNKNNGSNTLAKLVCHKGQGVCHVPPIVRSQQWNLIRCAYKARCPACWLKMCLRSFKMPPKLRSNLAEMLPANMQSIENLAMDTNLSTFGWKKIITPTFDSVQERLTPATNDNDHQRPTPPLLRARKKDLTSTSTPAGLLPTINTSTDKLLLRQKLSLKGPRVKHVCRSASIVLGQTPALFQTNVHDGDHHGHEGVTGATNTQQTQIPECHNDLSQDCDDCHHNIITKSSSGASSGGNSSSNDSELEDSKTSSTTSSINDTYHSSFKLTPKFQQVCSEPVYDALEVRQHGFGLVMSRGVVPKQVCFLCGSAGQEQLIHCAVCCEPYHDYCVGSDAATAAIGSWTCPKCVIICSGCSNNATRTTPCLLCRKLFHTTCLGIDNALCSNCLQCVDCGLKSVDQIIGDKVYCSKCFCSKYKDHRCPHCNIGFDSKNKNEVILCSECKCVWHTNCDNLNSEHLIMLRTLSLNSIYTCHKCLQQKNKKSISRSKTWRDQLCAHFVVGCLAVLRSLAELRVSQRSVHNKTVVAVSTVSNTSNSSSSNSSNSSQQQTSDKDCSRNYLYGDQTDSVPDYLKQKFFLRDCSVAIRNIQVKTGDVLTSNSALCSSQTVAATQPNSTSTSTSTETDEQCCNCTETLTLLEVKRKVVSKSYLSLSEFRHDLDLAIRGSGWNEVLNLVDDMFYKEFPWCTLASKATLHLPTCTVTLTTKTPCSLIQCTTCSTMSERSFPQASEDLRPLEDDLEEIYDSRTCVLCLNHGDKSDIEGGRLLYCESNTCIHVACALWSVGVHETLDGALLGVAATIRRARLVRCMYCKLRGATIDCSDQNCKATYHFPCAQKAGCVFVKNYRVFCVDHGDSKDYDDDDFQIRRSVYVHMDLKKHIVSESHSKWQFVVGSLVIRNLGSYYPILSDVDDVIIPSGMACTKLFWSTVDPWRIVQYNITTFIASDEDDVFCGHENNISIDHSDLPEKIDQKLTLIKKLFHETSESDTDYDSESETEGDSQVVQIICREVVNYLLDTICSVEDEELPQNATDILPPEIKDAIFEDLPHDVLDGISMQDIFPKLMSYDDLETFVNKVETKDHAEDDVRIVKRKSEPNSWTTRSLDDSHNISFAVKMNRGLKRSKSDVLPSNSFHPSISSNQQRSCSLTWSCKLNSNTTIKKRKISCVTDTNVLMLDTFQNHQDQRITDMFRRRILQVDGANDGSCSDSDDEIHNPNLLWNFNQQSTDEINTSDEPVRCQRCQCTYRTPDSYTRHLQSCDTMSTSDSDTEDQQQIDSKKINSTIVKHQQNIYSNITITSTTTSVLPSQQQSIQNQQSTLVDSFQSQQAPPQQTTAINQGFIQQNHYPLINDLIFQTNQQSTANQAINNPQMYHPQNITFNPAPTIQTTVPTDPVPILVDQSNQQLNQQLNQQSTIYPSIIDNNTITFQTTPQITPINIDFQGRTQVVDHQIVDHTPKYIIDTSHSHQVQDQQFTTQIQNYPTMIDSGNNMVILQSTNQQNDLQIVTPTLIHKSTKKSTTIPVTPSPKKVRAVRGPVRHRSIQQKQIHHIDPMTQFTLQQPTNTVLGMVQQTPIFQPTKQLFVHGLGTTDLVVAESIKPNFTTPNIQYILTTPNIMTTPQQNTFQIPQINPSDVMITTTPVPTMVGTIIQPQSFECGIVQHEQFMFTPQATVAPNPAPMMYVSGLGTNQPVFYGLETVVQNTVMSQQFMSKVSLPGLLAQNSYQTTQVFQTSTIEPVLPAEQPIMMQPTQIIPTQIVQRNTTSNCGQPQQNYSRLPTVITTSGCASNSIQNHHNITLPIAPIHNTNHKLPTNVVPPTPQVKIITSSSTSTSTSTAINKPSRPMNRVLPMAVTKPVKTLNSQLNVNTNLANVTNNTTNAELLRPIEIKSENCDNQQLFDKNDCSKTVDNIDKLTVINSTPTHTQHTTAHTHTLTPQTMPSMIINHNHNHNNQTQNSSDIKKMELNNQIFNENHKIRIIEQKTVQMNVSNQSQNHGQIQTFHVVSKSTQPPPLTSPRPASVIPSPSTNCSDTMQQATNLTQQCATQQTTPSTAASLPSIPTPTPAPTTDQFIEENQEKLQVSAQTQIQTQQRTNVEEQFKIKEPETESTPQAPTNNPSTSLKLVFQKQSEEGIYKITNKPKNLPDESEKDVETKTETPDVFISVVPDTKDTKLVREKKMKKRKNNIQHSASNTTTTTKKKSKLLFKIQSQDGLSLTCSSLTELWQKVFNLVQESRKRHNMVPLPVDALDGYEALGLKNQSLKCILEEMKKLRLAEKQKECEDGELDLGSVAGAIRCTPYNGIRADHDMFSWLASRHRQIEFPESYDDTISRRASSINLPIAMRYRNLKETSKHCVGVYRSNIHGRGLFCLRDIELGEMVIEYAGEVIRSSMTDMREKYYNSKGIGCYMFRIDDNLVVDATVKGNAARFINHSCDPNCYSRVLDILGHKHILIFALRKIQQGEELTYDYKFPFEEDKIPCTCGARRCRKYLN
ncbi:histone-lysine N-methyltransferase trithorax [Chrysoperla carnea]|uniref:histone-lysine N-methyltransferase trithorax n=1 Tax=Chrysoperla carnea TaxID=189513 RepID=UPI001D06924C|nr:histone-lysine N-methyltransferase trithorax [Chrysoperla carnea]